MLPFFKWTNLGTVLAVKGATLLQTLGLDGPEVFFLFIIMCGIVNLSLGSASAQWAVTAPIFVPMLMLIGFAPEVIQAAYRIGDSVTNVISPMMSYFGLILAIAARYKKDLGMGTLDSDHVAIFYGIHCWLDHFVLCMGIFVWIASGARCCYLLHAVTIFCWWKHCDRF